MRIPRHHRQSSKKWWSITTVLGAVTTMVAALMIGVFAGTASAHTVAASASCQPGVRVDLSNYDNSVGHVNHVTVTVDGVVKIDQNFGSAYGVTVPVPQDSSVHTWTVAVTAWDDPTGSNGWTKTYQGRVGPCDTTPPTVITVPTIVPVPPTCDADGYVVWTPFDHGDWVAITGTGPGVQSAIPVADKGYALNDPSQVSVTVLPKLDKNDPACKSTPPAVPSSVVTLYEAQCDAPTDGVPGQFDKVHVVADGSGLDAYVGKQVKAVAGHSSPHHVVFNSSPVTVAADGTVHIDEVLTTFFEGVTIGEVDTFYLYDIENSKQIAGTLLSDVVVTGNCPTTVADAAAKVEVTAPTCSATGVPTFTGVHVSLVGALDTTVGKHTVTVKADSGHTFADGSTTQDLKYEILAAKSCPPPPPVTDTTTTTTSSTMTTTPIPAPPTTTGPECSSNFCPGPSSSTAVPNTTTKATSTVVVVPPSNAIPTHVGTGESDTSTQPLIGWWLVAGLAGLALLAISLGWKRRSRGTHHSN